RREGATQRRGYQPIAVWVDSVGHQVLANSNQRVIPVTFPADYFTGIPIIVGSVVNVQGAGGIGSVQADVRFQDITADGCEMVIQRLNGNFQVNWFLTATIIAYQFLPELPA